MKEPANCLKPKKNRAYLYFIVPGLVLYTLFVILPILCSVYYSFFEWSGIGPKKFIGLDNFKTLLFGERMSPIFFNALGNNLKYLLCVLLIITPLQLFLAYMLFLKIPGSKYIRVMVFLPYVLSISIVGFFGILMFDGTIGFVNQVITALFGREHTIAWLGDPKYMMMTLVIVVIWQCVGANMMIYYADMQAISQDVIEASVMDGCGNFRRFFSIILPNLKASLTTNITLSVIFAMTLFGQPYVLVGTSGGMDNALDFISMVFYRYAFGGTYFGTTDIGFGSSISVVMLLIIFGAWLITNFFVKRIKK